MKHKLMTLLLASTLAVGGVGVTALTSTPGSEASAATAHNSCRSYVLRKGNTGYCVRMAQTLLKGPGNTSTTFFTPSLALDGDFGPATYNATVKWQYAAHITHDGVIGAQTWGSLCSVGWGSDGGTLSAQAKNYNYVFSITC